MSQSFFESRVWHSGSIRREILECCLGFRFYFKLFRVWHHEDSTICEAIFQNRTSSLLFLCYFFLNEFFKSPFENHLEINGRSTKIFRMILQFVNNQEKVNLHCFNELELTRHPVQPLDNSFTMQTASIVIFDYSKNSCPRIT